jgi:hypothetical protein
MKKAWPLNYAFSVGKIRAQEKFLIPQEVFVEAIEADLAEALRLFVESDLYSDDLLHVQNSQQLEEVLSKELSKLKKLMHDLILDKELLNLVEINSFACVEDILKTFPSQFLHDYLLHVTDMHNIKNNDSSIFAIKYTKDSTLLYPSW